MKKMSEYELHEHEFLLLLLDLADGTHPSSEDYKQVKEVQEQFAITEENKYDINYTLKESTVVEAPRRRWRLPRSSTLNNQEKDREERRMWPFDEENE